MSHHLQHLQSKGYTVFKDVIPKEMITRLRDHVRRGVQARPQAFIEIANPADVLNQEVKQEDPRMSALKRKFAAHREHRRRMLKEKRLAKMRAAKRSEDESFEDSRDGFRPNKKATDATASDIARLSQRITQQLAQLDPSDSRIENDPQRLNAINEHRCNLWMTESQTIGKEFVRGEFGKILGTLVEANIKNPVLFCDRPMFQLPYGRPSLMHFAAPFFGLDEVRGICNINDNGNTMNAISLWVPLEAPLAPTEDNLKKHFSFHPESQEQSAATGMSRRAARLRAQQQQQSQQSSTQPAQTTTTLSTPIRVLEGSHNLVRQKMLQDPKRYDMRLFRNDFNAVDSAIALWMRRFPELMQAGGTTASDSSTCCFPALQPIRATELDDVVPGSVVAFDPFTFCGLGPNVSTHSQCVVQFLITSCDPAVAKPSVHSYSWIRDWKSSSIRVDFGNDVVFPKLY